MANNDTSIELAWLHYIAGLTQAEIAKRRGISKATVHRLIRAAHESGAVRVIVSARPDEVLELEQKLTETFDLTVCRLAPALDPDGNSETQLNAVAALAAQSFISHVEAEDTGVIGLGAGRTLAAMARAVPRINRPKAEYVSLTGEFSMFRTGQSPDVILRLAERTGGTGYSITAPMFANTAKDREVLVAQDGIRLALEKTQEATTTFSGIGHLEWGSFLIAFKLISNSELAELKKLGVVADFCGNLLDSAGQVVDCDLGQRTVCCDIDSFRGKKNAAVALGPDKVTAIHAVLRAGVLTELTTDAMTAKALLEMS